MVDVGGMSDIYGGSGGHGGSEFSSTNPLSALAAAPAVSHHVEQHEEPSHSAIYGDGAAGTFSSNNPMASPRSSRQQRASGGAGAAEVEIEVEVSSFEMGFERAEAEHAMAEHYTGGAGAPVSTMSNPMRGGGGRVVQAAAVEVSTPSLSKNMSFRAAGSTKDVLVSKRVSFSIFTHPTQRPSAFPPLPLHTTYPPAATHPTGYPPALI